MNLRKVNKDGWGKSNFVLKMRCKSSKYRKSILYGRRQAFGSFCCALCIKTNHLLHVWQPHTQPSPVVWIMFFKSGDKRTTGWASYQEALDFFITEVDIRETMMGDIEYAGLRETQSLPLGPLDLTREWSSPDCSPSYLGANPWAPPWIWGSTPIR